MLNWFKTAWEKLCGWIQGAVDSIRGFFANLVAQIWQALNEFVSWFWDLFFHPDDGFLWWVVDMGLECGMWFADQLPDIDALLGTHADTFRTAMDVISMGNRFLPLVESIVLIFLFLIFISLFLVSKLILKLIPTIG